MVIRAKTIPMIIPRKEMCNLIGFPPLWGIKASVIDLNNFLDIFVYSYAFILAIKP